MAQISGAVIARGLIVVGALLARVNALTQIPLEATALVRRGAGAGGCLTIGRPCRVDFAADARRLCISQRGAGALEVARRGAASGSLCGMM